MIDRRRWYLEQLRTIAQAARWLGRPDELAQRIHEHIAKKESETVRAVIAARFESQGASAGGSWKALALRTAIQRQKQGFGAWNPILRRSGLLMRAAVGGKLEAYPDRIEVVFKDGPAPRYVGKGEAKKKRVVHWVDNGAGAVKVTKRDFNLLQGERHLISSAMGKTGNLMQYAEQLNEIRPFYGKPTPTEVEPVRKRGRELLRDALRRIANGEPIGL